jgi:hypothetical protein
LQFGELDVNLRHIGIDIVGHLACRGRDLRFADHAIEANVRFTAAAAAATA